MIDAPAGLVAELIDGVLYTNPRPGAPHARAASVLGMDLGTPFVKSVEVFRLEHVTVAGEDDVVKLEPFDAIPLELAGLWSQ